MVVVVVVVVVVMHMVVMVMVLHYQVEHPQWRLTGMCKLTRTSTEPSRGTCQWMRLGGVH